MKMITPQEASISGMSAAVSRPTYTRLAGLTMPDLWGRSGARLGILLGESRLDQNCGR
jgi:hypothetical protein